MEKLLEYLNSLLPEARAHFVSACHTSENYLRKAVSGRQLLGSRLCVAIEKESLGRVGRKDLHPEDWESHWPELATPSNTTPASAAVRERNPETNA